MVRMIPPLIDGILAWPVDTQINRSYLWLYYGQKDTLFIIVYWAILWTE
jgi:hypothetical protein